MGCSGGDTEGDLEKKARKAGWKEVVGAVAVTAGVFGGMLYVAHHFYGKGHDAGVYDGRKAGVVEGQELGVAQGRGFGFIENDADGLGVYLRRSDANGSTLYIFRSGEFNGKPSVLEFVELEREGGQPSMLYGDMDSDTSVHDGIVDYIQLMDTARELYRERDYAGNETLFTEGDNILDNTRKRFSEPEWLKQ